MSEKILYKFNILSDLYETDLISKAIEENEEKEKLIDYVKDSIFDIYLLYITIEELEYLNNEMAAEILNLNCKDKEEISTRYQKSCIESSIIKDFFIDTYLEMLKYINKEDILEFNIDKSLLLNIADKSISKLKSLYKNINLVNKRTAFNR